VRFENRFDVDAPLEQVWNAVLDVERVAPTMPGAEVLERIGDNVYKIAMKVKVGPISMTYRGEVEIADRNPSEHSAVMKAHARESRGQGAATAVATIVLNGHNGGTSATVTTDVQLSGRVASMGQGVLQDVSARLIDTFAANLAEMVRADTPESDDRPATSAPEMPAPPHAFDVGAVGRALVADRVGDPRFVLMLVAPVAAFAFVLGRRSRG
jgi:carbon monoxide dehydrogenase subunit G